MQLAGELAESYGHVTVDDDAAFAVRLMVQCKLPALLVLDSDRQPYAVLSCSQLVNSLAQKPGSSPQDSIDTRSAVKLLEEVAGRSVAQWLPAGALPPLVVPADTPILDVGARMAWAHSPVAVVVAPQDGGGRMLGVITAARLLEHLTPEEL